MNQNNYITIFYRKYGIKVAIQGKLSEILQMPGGLTQFRNAEDWYLNAETIEIEGARPITTTNFGGLSRLSSISNLILYHPLFGECRCLHLSMFVQE